VPESDRAQFFAISRLPPVVKPTTSAPRSFADSTRILHAGMSLAGRLAHATPFGVRYAPRNSLS